MKKENEDINIFEIIKLVAKYWLPIMAFTFIIAAVTYLVTARTVDPEYKSTATMLIGAGPDAETGLTIADVQVGKQLLADYKELAVSEIVMEQVIADLQIGSTTNEIRSNTGIESAGESRFFRISYTGKDPSETAMICNAIAESLVQKAKEVMGSSDIRIIYRARVPETPIGPNTILNTMIAAVFACLLACFFFLIKVVTNDTFHKTADIEKETGIKIMGVIPAPSYKSKIFSRKETVPLGKQPTAILESYKMFKTKLNFEFPDKEQNTVMFTTAVSEDSKTVSIINTAMSYERVGKKVLIMGCDLNNHKLYEMFNLNQSPGISNHLLDGYTFNETLQKVDATQNLYFLAYGRIFYEQTDLFSLEMFANMLKRIRTQYDLILIDAPPILRMTDTAIISKMVDIVILVVELNATKRETVMRAKDVLLNIDTRISGILVNESAMSANKTAYQSGAFLEL